MIDHDTTIHVAHAIGRRGGTHYRARAYAVTPIGAPCSFSISIDDSYVEAERNAVQYVKDSFRRDGLPVPCRVVNHGRMTGALLDRYGWHA